MRASAALSLVLWPVIVAFLSLRWTLRHGRGVRARTDKSLLRQIREQFEVARRSSVLPLRYYQNELFDDALRARAQDYILFHELKTVLFGLIKMHLPAGRRDTLKHKDQFERVCRVHGLPCAALILSAYEGRIVEGTGGEDRLPACDLFVKPRIGKGGRGAERWLFDAGRKLWRHPDGRELDRDGLLARILSASSHPGVIVERLLHTHPDLSDLTPGALITARLVTQTNPQGAIELTAAILRLPRSPQMSVDNVVQGGIACEIDLLTGRLGRAADYRQAAYWYDSHPTTGGRIAGRSLPHWQQTIELVKRAHLVLAPERGCIGWDIGQCEGGPCIVEANLACDLDFLQRPLRRPLGNERVGELFAFHLLRAERREPPLVATHAAPNTARS
jgi:hypothetical protein